MPEPMPEPTLILKKIGLTDEELTAMQTDFNGFAERLNHAQKQSLIESIPSAEEAAATLGPDVTPEYLERFIRAHAPKGASVVLINSGGGH